MLFPRLEIKKFELFFMIGSCLMIALEGSQLLKKEREFIVKNQIAGVVLFQRNIKSFKQLSQLNRQIKTLTQPSPLIAIDMEGGLVNRFSHLKESKGWPSAEELSCFSPQKIFLRVKKQAIQLKSLGIDLNFAPVVDLPLFKSKLLNKRTFGSLPSAILKATGPFLKGLQEGGVISCLKHFPGHGGVLEDSHETLPVDNRSLKELKPQLDIFYKLFKSYSTCIMTAHVKFPKIERQPATFSKIFLTQILKKRLGFEGLVISDDIDMKALTNFLPGESFFSALKAGCDMVISCQNTASPLKIIDYFERQTERKKEIKKELYRAAEKLWQLKKQL